MNDARLHRLAAEAAARIAAGRDPQEAILHALISAAGREPMGHVYARLPIRSRAICWALWGEDPLRAVDVHRIVGGSYHSVHELLNRLTAHGFVERIGFGRYALPLECDAPTEVPSLSVPPTKRSA